MKKRAKVLWSRWGASSVLATFLFFLVVARAHAPAGGKQFTGGRTIASLQEEDFDRRLLKLNLCYGVRLEASQCMLERKRVCKAVVVHELEGALEKAGNYLHSPMEIHCEDTAVGKPWGDDEIVSLRPNAEIRELRAALKKDLRGSSAGQDQHNQIREVCEFLTDCQWAMRPSSLSLRKLASCLTTDNALHREMLLNEIGSILFHKNQATRTALYPQLEERVSGRQ